VTAIAVPFGIVLSRRYHVVAEPGGRHAHANPTPMLGGLAMWIGFAITMAVFAPRNLQTLGLLVVSGLATGLLIIDDRWSMRPFAKLAVQVALALLAVVVFNYQIRFVGLPGGHTIEFALPVAVAVSVFWLVGLQNTVNFLDGADGLAAGVVAIVAMVLLLAAGQQKQLNVVQLSGALAGCCVGFLLFNFPPARVFMGDSGAHFLGVALGMISILGVAKVAVGFALAAPVIALAVPIADTGWAILRRGRIGASVATPDRLHLHHRLQSFGLDPRQTCYVFYAASALLRVLRGERPAWRPRAHPLRPRPDPRRRCCGSGRAHVDCRGGPSSAHRLACARTVAASPAERTRLPVGFTAGMASSRSPGPTGAELMGLGALLAGAVVAPILLGIVLDGALHTSPLFLFAGLVVGILASVGVVYVRYVKRYW